ncbi:MAG: hypothetical protein C6P36_13950 [Geobacillus sp.]|uniref:hypothetical protein n=1 Tax=Parageobacillus thermoglucosidasius TaxID=1426 RepID=UPI000E3B04D7|nr:MAG: hypothetical protein C6P36_13950 [Geobacillus sp.]
MAAGAKPIAMDIDGLCYIHKRTVEKRQSLLSVFINKRFGLGSEIKFVITIMMQSHPQKLVHRNPAKNGYLYA